MQALHRIDRATAGLVLFSVDPGNRHLYHELFNAKKIHKTYQAIARVSRQENIVGQQWEIKNRIVKSKPRFLMKVVGGVSNSHSLIRCLEQSDDKALFELNPITGKTHQLRLHMQAIGYPLLNDMFYPTLQPQADDVYSKPLQLLAKKLRFVDPVTDCPRIFVNDRDLMLK